MSSAPTTLTELFRQAGAALRVYDLGRRLRLLSNDEFERIEQLQTPYPAPYLHQAYIALMLWNPQDADQNAVWFLKLPLDEQGFMIPAVRDDLMSRLIANVQGSVAGIPEQDSLKDNPFAFKPADDKMAMFHARAAKDAGQPASVHFEAVQEFISGASNEWQTLSLQGLADYLTRMDEGPLEHRLAERLTELPEGFSTQLLGLLEHVTPGHALSQRLLATLQTSLSETTPNALKLALQLRALSCAKDPEICQQAVNALLGSTSARNIEVLSAIATRCENSLMTPSTLRAFLEALAQSDAGQQGFSRILAELMFLPVHRVLIVQALRQPGLSPALQQATEEMFGSTFRPLN